MIRMILLLTLWFASSCQEPTSALQGTWSVDQEATLAMATAKEAVWMNRYLRPLTDGLTVEISGDTIQLVSAKTKRTSTYSVLDTSDEGMTLLVSRGPHERHRVTVVFSEGRMVLAENDQAVVLRR